MPDALYGLTEDQAKRIADVCRKVESADLPSGRKTTVSTYVSPEVHPVEVTDCCDTSGRYPGHILQYDADTNTFSILDDCWIVELNGQGLAPGRFEGRRAGLYLDKPVFITSLPVVDCSSCPGSCSGSDGSFTPNCHQYGTGVSGTVDLWSYHCVAGVLQAWKQTETYVDGYFVGVSAPVHDHDEGCCDCP